MDEKGELSYLLTTVFQNDCTSFISISSALESLVASYPWCLFGLIWNFHVSNFDE